jgi:hypothetical protein
MRDCGVPRFIPVIINKYPDFCDQSRSEPEIHGHGARGLRISGSLLRRDPKMTGEPKQKKGGRLAALRRSGLSPTRAQRVKGASRDAGSDHMPERLTGGGVNSQADHFHLMGHGNAQKIPQAGGSRLAEEVTCSRGY